MAFARLPTARLVGQFEWVHDYALIRALRRTSPFERVSVAACSLGLRRRSRLMNMRSRMATEPSASNQDPTLYCAYFGGPRDGLTSGDLPASFSGKKLTGMVSKTPLTQPHELSDYAVYECVSEAQVDGFWEFQYQGMEGPNGEALGLATPEPGPAVVDPASGDSAITAAALVGVALSSLEQTFMGLYALVPGGGTYVRAGSLWVVAKGSALNKLNGCQLVEIEKEFVSILDLLDASGKTPTLDQISAASTSGGPASWDMQQGEDSNVQEQPRYSYGDMAEFNSLLLKWLEESTDGAVGPSSAGTYAVVELEGIPCKLSGETTRAGVRSYLSQLMTGDTKYSIVASSKGVIHRVAVGQTDKRIPGFYMYTQDQFETPQMIAPVDARAFTVISVARLILEAVGVLHARGHQRLRAFPNISGSGFWWRVAICSVDTLAGSDWPYSMEPGAVFRYTMAAGFEIDGLRVGPETSADEVADAILASLSDTGLGRDWAYAGWFVELLGIVRRHDCLPVGDDSIDCDDGRQRWPFTKQGLVIDDPPRGQRVL